MAGTIRYSMNVALANGSLNDTYNTSGLTASQTTGLMVRNVQTITTNVVGDAISMGGVINPGLAIFANLDPLNYIEIGLQVSGVFYPTIKLLAGQQAGPLFLAGPYLWAMANTASVPLFYIIYNN